MADFVFIKGYVDTTDLFTDEIIAAAGELGYKTFTIHKNTQEKDLKKLREKIATGAVPKALIGFNNMGYSLELDIPYVDILMDHPFHFTNVLDNLPEDTHLYCVDKNHVSFVKKFHPNIKNVGFLPHAGCINAINSLANADRDIDVLYAGSLTRTFAENLIPDFDAFPEIDGEDFFERVLGILISNPSRLTEDVISEVLSEFIPGISDEKLLSYISAFRFIDGFAVSFFRELSVRILVENGIKVHVLGSGWDSCEWADNANLMLLGRVEASRVPEYMMRSKVVLNTLTWFKDGAHDRIFNGMLAGAVVLTDTSKYLKETFSDRENIRFFELTNITELPGIVEEILSNSGQWEDISAAGKKLANKEHAWKDRLKIIIEELP